MKKIAFDVMGNDNGVEPAIKAVVSFVEKYTDFKFILVGDKSQICNFIEETDNIKIIDIKKQVDKNSGARAARDSKTSMAVAVNLVKEGEADAVISSGDSGIYLATATLQLRRLPGINRPAFMPIFPTIIENNKFVMMDVGANVETTSKMMIQWALLGSLFSETVLNIKSPRVGIVNIGTEDNKGKDFHIEAAEILKKRKDINYVGFVEPRELLNSVVDVAIVDGYGGNLILKAMEGTVLSLLKLLKEELMSKTKYKMGALLSKGAFKNVSKRLDYRNIGAAWIIGLNGIALKTHGSSDEKTYYSAFKGIAQALNSDAIKEFKEAFNGTNK
ncbi:MAG: phosphate acyltransferase PlsX [Mycoplasmataceae bacterium]|nr:phosphate acyltransferase PlsX [Mycoplasmataceae bacterium]